MTDRSFNACCRGDARVLVLGSLPGKRSIADQRYYAHPQNAFWPIMREYLALDGALEYDSLIEALLESGMALWDVLAEAQRPGSLDSRIEPSSVVFNPIDELIEGSPRLNSILLNGGKAMALFKQAGYLPVCEAHHIGVHQMPSTSPAFAAMSFDKKKNIWLTALEGALSR